MRLRHVWLPAGRSGMKFHVMLTWPPQHSSIRRVDLNGPLNLTGLRDAANCATLNLSDAHHRLRFPDSDV